MLSFILCLSLLPWSSLGCSDFFMNFSDPSLKLSVRTSDLTSIWNWTITAWPAGGDFRSEAIDWSPKYSTLGMTVNWIGDERYGFPSFFGDALNQHGLSCSVLALIDSEYEQKSNDPSVTNVLNAAFCHYATQMFADVAEVYAALDTLAIYGPDALASHYALRDATGESLVIECVNGKKMAYFDNNDGADTFGIMTNEPTFDYHLMNIKHYEWKRTLTRQAVAVPGGFYPEERFLRIHMVKSGMQPLMESTADFQTAFSMASQVLNTITVPMGEQYGTDSSGSSEEDHTVLGLIRDHHNKVIYWRDAYNPTFRRISLDDALKQGQDVRPVSLVMTAGPYCIDMSDRMA